MRTTRNYNHVNDVSRTGAPAGAILTGTIRSNAGLRIRVLEEQPRKSWGPVRGPFEILDAGENMHTETLAGLAGQILEAPRLLEATRRAHPMSINVVNCRVLMVEKH